MSGSHDPSGDSASEEAAAARLEQALERIAALTGRVPTMPEGENLRDIADKLDDLIARLRAGLGADQG